MNTQFNSAREEQEKQLEAKDRFWNEKVAIGKTKEVTALNQIANLEQ